MIQFDLEIQLGNWTGSRPGKGLFRHRNNRLYNRNVKETDTIGLGLSPRRDKQEKTKISEHYRKMQEVIASESHQKMTRLTQRRHSTCQKINRLARTNSGPADTRKNGLQLQLTEINEEIHKTVIQSKVNSNIGVPIYS